MKKILLFFLMWGLAAGIADNVCSSPGTSGAQVLQQQNGARPAGMGGAFAACSNDIYALNVNPAGAHNLKKIVIMLMHVSGFEGLSTEYLTGIIPLPGLGVLGAQFLYRSQPIIDNNVAGEATVNVKDMIYGVSFARSLVAGFSLGLNVKLTSLELGPVDTSVLSIDLGTQYQVDEDLSLGLVIRNLGTPVQFKTEEDPLPLTVVAGTCYTFYNQGPHQVVTVLDIDYLVPEQNLSVHVGGEYWFRRMLALRLGYVYSVQRSVKGLSTGIGFKFKAGKVDLVLDYTLMPQFWEDGDFETENLFTLSVEF